MAKVQCPECNEINKDMATKCFKCGTSLRRERIKTYVEKKHGNKLNYKKKHKGKSDSGFSQSSKSGSWIGKLIMIFVILFLLGVGGFAAAIYFGMIPLPV